MKRRSLLGLLGLGIQAAFASEPFGFRFAKSVAAPASSGGGGGASTTWDPATVVGATSVLSNGNLTLTNTQNADYGGCISTTSVAAGNKYAEVGPFLDGGASGSNGQIFVGLGAVPCVPNTGDPIGSSNQCFLQSSGGLYATGAAPGGAGNYAVAPGDYVQIAYKAATGEMWFGVNNVWGDSGGAGSGDPAAGTNPCFTFPPGTEAVIAVSLFSVSEPAPAAATLNTGATAFSGTKPVGFSAWG